MKLTFSNSNFSEWLTRQLKNRDKFNTRYPIVARCAWPTFRPSASREQRFLSYNVINCYTTLDGHVCSRNRTVPNLKVRDYMVFSTKDRKVKK